MIRGMMLEHVEKERRDDVKNKLRTKLKCYTDSYAKGHKLLESLKKEKKSCSKNLGMTETKAKELISS